MVGEKAVGDWAAAGWDSAVGAREVVARVEVGLAVAGDRAGWDSAVGAQGAKATEKVGPAAAAAGWDSTVGAREVEARVGGSADRAFEAAC